jgi:hypothetical protein
MWKKNSMLNVRLAGNVVSEDSSGGGAPASIDAHGRALV